MNELLPLMTYSLLISISLISIIGFNNTALFDQCKHYPYLENKQKSFYRWFTCGFLHANWLHLFFNAFVLWQFGSVIEKIYKENVWNAARRNSIYCYLRFNFNIILYPNLYKI
ncbi:MAG: rhomboid family intramembrane serine protease [Saprospiraceae bacterium]|nr:rhomboid family intramembrane serine protease [Saprospiraceae bacterium]